MRLEEGRQEWRKIKGNRGKNGKIEKVDGRGGKEEDGEGGRRERRTTGKEENKGN